MTECEIVGFVLLDWGLWVLGHFSVRDGDSKADVDDGVRRGVSYHLMFPWIWLVERGRVEAECWMSFFGNLAY